MLLLGPGCSPVAKFTLGAAILGLGGAAATAASAHVAVAAAASTTPSIARVTCRSSCDAAGAVAPGGVVTVLGRNLDRASGIVFFGGRGTRDDVRTHVRPRAADRLDVRVPPDARSGRVAALTAAGAASRTSTASVRIATPAAEDIVAAILSPVPGVAGLDAAITTRKAGRAATSATLTYVSRAPTPVAVRVDVVRVADGSSVFSDARSAVAPEVRQSVTWDGRTAGGVALDGRYELRVTVGDAAVARTLSAEDGAVLGGAAPQDAPPPPGSERVGAFTFVGAIFPVRGRHSFGDDANRFGAVSQRPHP